MKYQVFGMVHLKYLANFYSRKYNYFILKYQLFWKDFSLWLLGISNLYILLQYISDHHSANAVALLYWMQGLLIGGFNALGILFFRNSSPRKISIGKRISRSVFFTLHYCFFHAVIFIFLLDKAVDVHFVNYKYLKISAIFLFLSLLTDFILTLIKFEEEGEGINVELLFFIPYIRIIPLAAVIFFVTFLTSAYSLIFIILKTFGDIATYILFKNLCRNKFSENKL
ncbi:MAG TPA: DUF6498-containing protein [Chitinophagaceae bacterium]|nr:DUF6498-containing protein [Chitinophagaceae bacterium]